MENMENIDKLILTEFSHAGYSLIDRVEHSPIFANQNKSDFWMIFDEFDLDADKQKNLFDKYVKATKSFKAAEKNISVLVLKKIHQFDGDSHQRAVELENDKLFFKKYVLLYTEGAWAKLQGEILIEDEKQLSDYLCDRKVFEKLKDDKPDGAYTLLYGIAHKLPFLLVKMEKSQLKLAYPKYWSSPAVGETNDWVAKIPDDDEGMEKFIERIFKSLDNE